MKQTQCNMVHRSHTADSNLLSSRQRLDLVFGTDIPNDYILKLKDSEIDVHVLKNIPVSNFVVSGLLPLDLKKRGVQDAYELVSMGFDALHLTNPEICNSAIYAFGAQSVVDAFLLRPVDAVCVAGSSATLKLDVSVQALLEICEGHPVHALAVLKRLPDLRGVHTLTLIRTGLNGRHLEQLGISVECEETLIGGRSDFLKLGF